MESERKMLSEEGRRALSWIADNDHTRSRWLVNGRPPRREKPSQWTHIEFSSTDAMIRIPTAVWEEIRDLVGGAELTSRRMFTLTEAGRSALTSARPEE